MPVYPAKPRKRRPTHPGAVVGSSLEALGRTKSEVAGMLGISRQHLHGIIAGDKSVSPDVAARLGKLFGNGPGLWLRMQAAYDTWQVEHNVDTSNIPTLERM